VSLELRSADALAEQLPAADAAVANVSASFVQELMGKLQTRSLIASGYLEAEQPLLPGFRRAKRRVEDGWAADLFRHEE
jgi:hypothetical protein